MSSPGLLAVEANATALPAPGTPVPTQVTASSVTLSWAPAAGPVAGYLVQVIDEPLGLFHTAGGTGTTTFTHTGLSPERVYIYRVAAEAAPGSGHTASRPSGLAYVTTRPPTDARPAARPVRSIAATEPVTVTTRAVHPQPTCRVNLLTFGGQYQLTVTVENLTAATVLENWSVRFTMPAAHKVSYSFNTAVSRTGDDTTARPVADNARIGPGSATSFGIIATYPAGSPLPSGFALTPAAPRT
jgi:hypothetical protein